MLKKMVAVLLGAGLVALVIVMAAGCSGSSSGGPDHTVTPSRTIAQATAAIRQQATAVSTRPNFLQVEQDESSDIPGTYVPSHGRNHFSSGFGGHQMTPFCASVPSSDSARLTIIGSGTPSARGTVNATPTVTTNCYTSNPPSSGEHLNVQRNVDVGGGNTVNIPADPDVYPDGVEIPRDSIPHILEHAGVFVGWNCANGDAACTDAAQKLEDLVNLRIDNYNNRVVMAHDNDLPEGTFGLASWTRVFTIDASDWANQTGAAENFIATNSCRFDPEGFCS